MPPESSHPKDWPFHDPPNVAVFTTTHVFRAGRPILRVFHDDEDGAWQFHYGGAKSAKDAMIVALSEVLERDPSIAELADLPYGWCAERSAPGQPWNRSAKPPEPPDSTAKGYPYPTMEEDGYELSLFEENMPEVASDAERFAAKPGDTVKLVFTYKEPVRNHGLYDSERMWVEIVEIGEGCLIGRLDNTPQFTDLLKSDSRVQFHPKHILTFWAEPQ